MRCNMEDITIDINREVLETYLKEINIYYEKKYEENLGNLIDDLIDINKDILKSRHFGFAGSIGGLDIDSYKIRLLEDFFGIKLIYISDGTFIIKIRESFNNHKYDIEEAHVYGYFVLDNNKIDHLNILLFGNTFELIGYSTYNDEKIEEIMYYDKIIKVDGTKLLYECDKNNFLEIDCKDLEDFEKDFIKCNIIDVDDYLENKFGKSNYSFFMDSIKNHIKEWNKKLLYLEELPLSKLRKKNRELFNDRLLSFLFKSCDNLELKNDEQNIIKQYLTNCNKSNEILRMLYTYVYTSNIFTEDNKYCDYVDLTFITVSIFKVVEVIFNDLLNHKFGYKTIRDKKNQTVDFSKEDLTLGKMQQFFLSDDSDIKSFVVKKQSLANTINDLLEVWIKKSRNGFLHKDIIDISNTTQLHKSIDDSIRLLCYLILFFE